jgi:hypothetical protein
VRHPGHGPTRCVCRATGGASCGRRVLTTCAPRARSPRSVRGGAPWSHPLRARWGGGAGVWGGTLHRARRPTPPRGSLGNRARPTIRGDSAADHLALACQGCHNFKYNKTSAFDPGSRQRVPLFHPRQQHWHDHFAWNHDWTLLIGFTPTGRATVEELHLNRPGVLNLRHLLLLIGRHPPQFHDTILPAR